MPRTGDALSAERPAAWPAGTRDAVAESALHPRAAASAEIRRLRRDVAIVAGLALVIRLLQIDRPPQFDELYHVLAARSWAHDGTLTIGGGTYTRAAGFTVLIGLLFKLLGDSLAVARLPSIIAGTVWVGAVHLWTGRRAGPLAGAVTGLLFAFDPGSIYLAEFARFYALQGMFVWFGAAALHALIEERPAGGARFRSALAAGGSWLAALYLQITTMIALAGVGAWAGWRGVIRLREAGHRNAAARRAIVLLGVLSVLAVAAAAATGVLGKVYALYRQTPIWGEPTKNDWQYYARWFIGRYPVLWLLLPFAGATALLARRGPARFAFAVFAISLALFSGAALKTERYIYFAMPFFFVIWGIAIAEWIPGITGTAARLVASLSPALAGRVRTAVLWTVVGIFGGWLLFYDPAFAMTGRMMIRDWKSQAYQESDWAGAAPALRRLADSADVVISTALPKTLYYVGRADVTLSLTELGELGPSNGQLEEFAIDPRTGRPAISSPQSLERIMACYARGLVLIEDVHWSNTVVLPEATRAFLTAHTEEVPLPAGWLLHARRWTNPSPATGGSCPPWRAGRSSKTQSSAARQPQ